MAAGAWNGALSIGTAAVGGYDWIAASKPEARSAASAAAGIPTDALPRDDIRLHLLRDKGFLLHPDLAAEAGAAEIVFFDGLERPMERLLSGAGTDPAAWAAEWTSEIRREGIRDIAKLKAPGRIWRIDGGGGISALRISDAAASGLHLAFVASDRPRRLSAALLPTAGLTARVGGKGVPISPDGAFRSFVEIPAGAVGLDLLYSDEGWAKGGALAGLLLLSAALLLFGGRIFDGRIADGRQTSTPPSGGGTKSNVADTTEEVE